MQYKYGIRGFDFKTDTDIKIVQHVFFIVEAKDEKIRLELDFDFERFVVEFSTVCLRPS